MTRFAPLWQQAGSYPSQLDRSLLGALWPGGGGDGAPPAAVNNTMQVTIPPGWLGVPLQAGQGSALCRWDAAEVVTLAAAPGPGQTRWDFVVCQVRDHDLGGGPDNDFIFTTATGTPGTSALGKPGEEMTPEQQAVTFPAIPANSVPVALVNVGASVANLNGAAFVDRRPLGHLEMSQANAYTCNPNTNYPLSFSQIDGGAGAFLQVYTVPMSGRYLVTANAVWDRALTQMQLVVTRNDVVIARGNNPSGVGVSAPGVGIATVVRAAKDDGLRLSCWINTAANIFGGVSNNYVSFQYLGP